MNEIDIYDGQNLIDIALQEYGSVEGVVALAMLNNIPVDDDLKLTKHELETGIIQKTLKIDSTKMLNPDMVKYFQQQGIRINTGNEGVYDFNEDFNDDFN